ALRQPERFAAAASLSGALDVTGLRTQRVRPEDPRLSDRVFGDAGPAGSADDLLWLLDQADPASLPPLYVCCGTEDALLDDNRAFVVRLGSAGGLVHSNLL